ncbi:aspartate aminotransferase family protein [Altibacter sp. HG106]|uniref:aspartate aminotransferase family protein n=1 Tax=Altibacter sp. HG106 TaxID=3023937 RepID=UPI0023504115|nr:aspartate aminotransferase family protein [Altibacter sp. HG106]MDC7993941.1 aspartate aminotransferase family protein [Altibacter sp. HG106]
MKKDFFTYQAQTTPHPLAMEVSHAKGSYIYDTDGTAHLDFVAGVSACPLGHAHPAIIQAVNEQMAKYAHVMVYGEYIQQPSVQLAKRLAEVLPEPLSATYLVNSGTEAIEGALKLARRVTGRSELLYAEKAYHGNTFGSLSVMGYEARKTPFAPLLPDCHAIRFNSEKALARITTKTAAVILETIQGGAGFIMPANSFLQKIKARCEETGTLLILDEIQPGFGRTGTLFGFQHFDVVPDILVMGKGMGGGLPIGAFTASEAHMALLKDNPKLGHITTFGGNAVISAAALATLNTLVEGNLIPKTLEKERLFREHLQHPLIEEIRGKGMMLALIMKSDAIANEVILRCKACGLILFWLLFEPKAVRITPPLTLSEEELLKGCAIITEVLDSIQKEKR